MSLSPDPKTWITIETDPGLLAFEIERTEAQIALYAGDLHAGDLEACGGSLEICRNSMQMQQEVLKRLNNQGERLRRAHLPVGQYPINLDEIRTRMARANALETYDILERITGTWPRLGPKDEYWMCCPLPGHEDRNPSFHMAQDGRWKCFGCGQGGGDKVSFAAAYLGSSQMAGLLLIEETFGL